MDQGKHMINAQNYLNTKKNLNTIQAIKLTKEIPVLSSYIINLILFLSTSRRELSLLHPESNHSRAKPHLLPVPSPKPTYTSPSPICPPNTILLRHPSYSSHSHCNESINTYIQGLFPVVFG